MINVNTDAQLYQIYVRITHCVIYRENHSKQGYHLAHTEFIPLHIHFTPDLHLAQIGFLQGFLEGKDSDQTIGTCGLRWG